MTVVDNDYEFDCPKYRNFSALNEDDINDNWFDEQRALYVNKKEQTKSVTIVTSKARKSIANVANKENASANAPIHKASVNDMKRKSIKNKQPERVPLTSRVSTKPTVAVSQHNQVSRPSVKPRPSVSSNKSSLDVLSKPRSSVSVPTTSRSNASSRIVSARPSLSATPATSTNRVTTAQRFSTQPQHHRSVSTPVQPPKQQSAHQRSRSTIQHQTAHISQPVVASRVSSRPSVAVVAPSAVATIVRSVAPLTRPTAMNFATDSRAQERAAKEKQRTNVPKSASAPSTSRVHANPVSSTTVSQQSSRQRAVTRCEPFKLATNERKRRQAPPSSAPATPARTNQATKRLRPAPTQSQAKLAGPTPAKLQTSSRPLTSPSPFPLRSLIRHEAYQARLAEQLEAERLAEAEAKKFRAPPLDSVRHVLTASPFVPKLEHCHTEPDNVSLKCEVRASARRAWDEMLRIQEEENSEIERKRTAERARAAAAELAALRQSLVHHPLQVPSFQHVFHPHPSTQPVTEAKSPCLLTKSRAIMYMETHSESKA